MHHFETMLQLLLLFLLILTATNVESVGRSNLEEEILSEWVGSIRVLDPGVTSLTLAAGDSLDLDCRRMRHVAKIKVPIDLEWRLLDRLVVDEGIKGRIQILDNDGRLTVENVNERDSGLYAAYTAAGPLASMLESNFDQNTAGGSRIALCIFLVSVTKLREFTMREGEHFEINTTRWLTPIANSMKALGMSLDEWMMIWFFEGEEVENCKKFVACSLNVTASQVQTQGRWRLEMHSLTEKMGQRRTIFEFQLNVKPPLNYLQSFPLATHKFYMIYVTLMIAMFLLSLHLFNNLNWTPFAFDVLPDQVSPRVVLDQAGVFLKDVRVKKV